MQINGATHPQKSLPPIKGELIHPNFNKFCKWVNGYVEGEEKDDSKHNYFSLRDITKAVWPLYLPLQVMGLISDKAAKLARAWYGVCWAIVYSCLRPWKENRDTLTEKTHEDKPASISEGWKKLYNVNEYFRAIMGSVVTAVYGSGALGMLFSCFKGDDDLFDKAANVYQTGMMNQNQIFASMNAGIFMKRKLNPSQLHEVDKEPNGYKANIELVDTFLFIPNIITRGLDTFRLFGMNVNEGLQRFINAFGYFSYGTWATRFGIMKSSEADGGDLEKIDEKLTGKTLRFDQFLHDTQKTGGKIFHALLPALSWIAAFAELFGFREFAEKTFKLEGICERLNPTIAAWCSVSPLFKNCQKLLNPAKDSRLSGAEV